MLVVTKSNISTLLLFKYLVNNITHVMPISLSNESLTYFAIDIVTKEACDDIIDSSHSKPKHAAVPLSSPRISPSAYELSVVFERRKPFNARTRYR